MHYGIETIFASNLSMRPPSIIFSVLSLKWMAFVSHNKAISPVPWPSLTPDVSGLDRVRVDCRTSAAGRWSSEKCVSLVHNKAICMWVRAVCFAGNLVC